MRVGGGVEEEVLVWFGLAGRSGFRGTGCCEAVGE